MENIARYRELVKNYLKQLENLSQQQPRAQVETYCIFDEQREQYLLMNSGWERERRVESATLHVRIRGGKIWIEDDWTEEGIANFLLASGVPKEDIVLAWQPPEMRQYTEFAAAV